MIKSELLRESKEWQKKYPIERYYEPNGMRMSEQLRMKRHQADFLRSIVARKIKNGRPRDIPMNDDVREALAQLCLG